MDTNFKFCILMHPKESRAHHVGTGRLTNIALKNCSIIIDKSFDENITYKTLLTNPSYYPMLLYPGKNSINVTNQKLDTSSFNNKIPIIFILDGTWPCAKSMMKQTKSLHNLPRISFTSSKESQFAIRQQPAKYCLSTIESVHELLKGLENQGLENLKGKESILLKTLDKLVAFHKKCASDPNLAHHSRKRDTAYTDPKQRKPSKKWQQRRICFEPK